MTAELLYEAIGEISESYIDEADVVIFRPRRNVIRHLIAACLSLLLLALPVSAEMRTGYISNLLMPLYGGAQTELVDSVGVPVNAKATVNGYTLTANAIVGDRYNIGLTYTLRREDGGALPEDLHFDFLENTIRRGGGSGWYSFTLSEDRTTLTITQSLSSNNRIFTLLRRNASVSFTDLVTGSRDDGTFTVIQEGTWQLNFAIRYEDTTTTLRPGDLVVHNTDGDRFTVHKIHLSPFGINMKLTVPNAHYGLPLLTGSAPQEEREKRFPKDFQLSLRLTDGTLLPIEGGTSSGGSLDKPTHKGTYHAMFDQPIPLNTVAALVLCDTEYPLN